MHINAIVVKAHQRANVIYSAALLSRDLSMLVRGFLVYVRPLLEYNIALFGLRFTNRILT